MGMMTKVRKFNKSTAMFFVVLLLLSVGTVQANNLDDREGIPWPDAYWYGDRDIRSSILNIGYYETDEDTQLYHVVASKNFTVKPLSETKNIRKGDILLMVDVPSLQKSDRAAIVVGVGFTIEISRDNLEKNKDGSLYKSNAIAVETAMLTEISCSFHPDKPGVGKYIYEEPDFKSKRLGVFRRGTELASEYNWDEITSSKIFFSLSLPGEKTGYVYAGYWEEGKPYLTGGVSHSPNHS